MLLQWNKPKKIFRGLLPPTPLKRGLPTSTSLAHVPAQPYQMSFAAPKDYPLATGLIKNRSFSHTAFMLLNLSNTSSTSQKAIQFLQAVVLYTCKTGNHVGSSKCVEEWKTCGWVLYC